MAGRRVRGRAGGWSDGVGVRRRKNNEGPGVVPKCAAIEIYWLAGIVSPSSLIGIGQ